MAEKSWLRPRFKPNIWIEENKMYASCFWLALTSKTKTANRRDLRAFETRLWRVLHDDWELLAQDLKLKYRLSIGVVEICFLNDEDFVIAKMHDVDKR